MPPRHETEICVIGGGPAGSGVALRLAQLGHRVTLVERAAFPRAHIGESLPPSILPTLAALGLRDRIERAGFLRSHGSILYWGGEFERRGTSPGAPGLLVDRARFDALLLHAAAEAGVTVLQPARAHRPRRTTQGWDIPLRGETPQTIHTRLLIDAAGKQAGLARKFRRCSQPLLALYAYWQPPPGFGPETRVEAGEAQWYWGALLPDGTVNATIFLDPARAAGLSPADRRDLYLNLLAQSTLLSPCLDTSRRGHVRSCDATSYAEQTPPSAHLLRVGEASFSIDPLSSQGVQSALGQTMQTAAVAHTLLTRPDDTELALTFAADRQTERIRTHATLAADYYAQQAQHHPNPFWTDRATPPGWLTTPHPDLLDTLPPSDLPLRLSPEAALTPSAIQTEALIRSETALTHPNLNRPVVFLDGLRIAPLLHRVPPGQSADVIACTWASQITPEQATKLLTWLWRNRILIPAQNVR
ncbi:MAG: NAD(P)/FAD-dependent oxidoreductase [Ruegeria sp.]